MLSLDSLGLCLTAVPWPLGRLRLLGDGVLVVGPRDTRSMRRRAIHAFAQANSGVTAGAMTLPRLFSRARAGGHWPFAKKGIPASIVTDAAPIWPSLYPGRDDVPGLLDYDRLGRTAIALCQVVRELANLKEEL